MPGDGDLAPRVLGQPSRQGDNVHHRGGTLEVVLSRVLHLSHDVDRLAPVLLDVQGDLRVDQVVLQLRFHLGAHLGHGLPRHFHHSQQGKHHRSVGLDFQILVHVVVPEDRKGQLVPPAQAVGAFRRRGRRSRRAQPERERPLPGVPAQEGHSLERDLDLHSGGRNRGVNGVPGHPRKLVGGLQRGPCLRELHHEGRRPASWIEPAATGPERAAGLERDAILALPLHSHGQVLDSDHLRPARLTLRKSDPEQRQTCQKDGSRGARHHEAVSLGAHFHPTWREAVNDW